MVELEYQESGAPTGNRTSIQYRALGVPGYPRTRGMLESQARSSRIGAYPERRKCREWIRGDTTGNFFKIQSATARWHAVF
eukprot:2768416-Rhodomonas_salina.1